MKFGPYVRELRKVNRIGLREFCMSLDFDPSNWSKVEREILHPPTDDKVITEIASVLNISKGEDEWHNLINYASIDRGMIPRSILSNEELMKKLPVFFRTIEGKKPDGDELKRLIQLIQDNV